MEFSQNIEMARGLTLVADDCYNSLLVLLEHDMTSKSVGILFGHCLEASLKAHLVHSGYTENELKNLGHDLKLCWIAASKLNIGLDENPPKWVVGISYRHYNMRYRYPNLYEDPWLPHPSDYVDDLNDIIELLRKDFLYCGGKYVEDI